MPEAHPLHGGHDLLADEGKAKLVVLPADVNAVATAKDYFSLVDTIVTTLAAVAK